MRIAVIGAGNMGCLYGANLARVGAEVVLLDTWEEHVEQVRDHGLSMDGLHGEFSVAVEATTDAGAVEPVDLAIVLVNAYDTPGAAAAARLLLRPDGCAVTLQNGLGNVEVLQEALGNRRVLAGLSFHSADLQGPGAVRHTNEGPTYLGELDGGRTDRLANLRDWMERARMAPVVEADITATIWGKFVHNCAINALCAVTDLRPGHIRHIEALDRFQSGIVEETLALVQARGIEIPSADPLGDIKAYCAGKFHRVSMLQHLARGRQTEIDALNGYVVRESRKLGLSCPYSESLTALVEGLQYAPAVEL